MTKKLCRLVLVFTIVVTTTLSASCTFVSNILSSNDAIEVGTASVTAGSLSEVVKASGIVVPDQTQAVTSDVNGDIGEILVEEGDDVVQGQTLINLKQIDPVNSPTYGRVLQVNAIEGQMVAPGTPLLTIGDDSSYMVNSDRSAEISGVEVKLGDNITQGQVVVRYKQPQPATSPVTGKVYQIGCLRGQVVTPGTPLMTIVEDDTENVWQVTANTTAEVNDILVEGAAFFQGQVRDTLVALGDDVTKDQELVTFKALDPVESPVSGKVLRLECIQGQLAALGTPLLVVGHENAYLVKSDSAGEIQEILVELGDNVTRDETVVNFKQPDPIKSPVSGRVIEKDCIIGQKITTGTPLIVIGDVDPFYVTANVDEADIAGVAVDQSVKIELDAYPGMTVSGRVDSITFNAVTTPLGATDFPVKIEVFPSEAITLRLGMSADVDIVYATHPDVIVIPDDALVRRDGKQVVFVVENSVANKRDVEVGIRTDNLSEILSGLSPGEEIVTTNADLLDGGEKVIPLGR